MGRIATPPPTHLPENRAYLPHDRTYFGDAFLQRRAYGSLVAVRMKLT
jgi:hypothetical protein